MQMRDGDTEKIEVAVARLQEKVAALIEKVDALSVAVAALKTAEATIFGGYKTLIIVGYALAFLLGNFDKVLKWFH